MSPLNLTYLTLYSTLNSTLNSTHWTLNLMPLYLSIPLNMLIPLNVSPLNKTPHATRKLSPPIMTLPSMNEYLGPEDIIMMRLGLPVQRCRMLDMRFPITHMSNHPPNNNILMLIMAYHIQASVYHK